MTVSIAAFAMAYTTFKKGSSASPSQTTHTQEAATPKKASFIRDVLGLFLEKGFWQFCVLFVITFGLLLWQMVSKEALTRLAVIQISLLALLSFLYFVSLVVWTYSYFKDLRDSRKK